MSQLTTYIAQANVYRRLFRQPVLDPQNLSAADVQYLLDRIEGDLSPENLTCDGELRGHALKVKHRMLLGAQKELARLTAA